METRSVEDARLADLVQILAHRISSLTAGVHGYADLLADTVATTEQRKLIGGIVQGTSRIDNVLSDLRRFARPISACPVYLPVDRLLGNTLLLIAEPFRGRFSIANDVSADLRLYADPDLSRQALFAILQNALEASYQRSDVRLHARDGGRGIVEIAVENEGTPILPEEAPRIFDPFFTTKAQNLGLGLTVARKIAREQGGSVELASAAHDVTTRIVLSIPAQMVGRSVFAPN